MFLVPLNYDRFFKKVFSDLFIAKSFLEDFLAVKIQEIERLPDKHRITDDAAPVEFDFRCKIADRFVMVEMQQWHKQDVVERFYLYHCLNTSLQSEDLPLKRLSFGKDGQTRKIADYGQLQPAITIIWLVHDTLGTQANTLRRSMLPEETLEFIQDDGLWENTADWNDVKTRRDEVLNIVSNNAKGLGFLQRNRLIFALQKNIVHQIHHGKAHPKYARWFSLADKTLNENNDESDFSEFEQEEDFKSVYLKIKKRLSKKGLTLEEEDYLTSEVQVQREIQAGFEGIEKHARREGLEQGMAEGLEKGLQKGLAEGLEKGLQKGETRGALRMILEMRFGAYSESIAQKIARAELHELVDWKNKARRVDSLDELSRQCGWS